MRTETPTLHHLIVELEQQADGFHPSEKEAYWGSTMRIALHAIAQQLKAIEAREVALIAEWREVVAQLEEGIYPYGQPYDDMVLKAKNCADQLDALISSPLSAQKEQA